MQKRKSQTGFTFIELIITVVVLLIVIAVGMPSLFQSIDNQRVSGAAQAFLSDVQYARAESIKQNTPVYLAMDDTEWCYGLDDTSSASCICGGASVAGCTLGGVTYTVDSSRFPGVSMSASLATGSTITFDPVRGTMNPIGTVYFSSDAGGMTLNVVLSRLGRAKICATKGSSWGYDAC
ncbi:GspH/FimT family pseudopilin [Neptuniibacter sp. CAU 1671]|uniref:GspH/FimT family pseudopilin n=1 Tax=Neptuniibacter sp. CAU 1671 TaxID=3032593 RepID=UPI0023DABA33|nr:GspH/FimT family pseudopilin [Neptuniibacter sp. CAU 1671]MDF2182330.1 GspH/FimT family pseudopilin [Neptuniibacter sp. CAU 1671]